MIRGMINAVMGVMASIGGILYLQIAEHLLNWKI